MMGAKSMGIKRTEFSKGDAAGIKTVTLEFEGDYSLDT
jgi:protein subunit release factor B